MGGIASVYIKPDIKEEPDNAATNTDSVQLDIQKMITNGFEFRLREPPDDDPPPSGTETDLRRTIQYLAVDNARLSLQNQRLQIDLENSSSFNPIIQPEIFGETIEEKVLRLESTLAAERTEKWDAIEKCERFRIELVNCKQELEKRPRNVGSGGEIGGDLETFRAHLREKREERQKCLAAKSKEMQDLRDNLEREKENRQKLEREIALINRLQNKTHDQNQYFEMCRQNDHLTDQIESMKKTIDGFSNIKLDNVRLTNEIKSQEETVRDLNTDILQLKNDVKTITKKLERSERDKQDLVIQRERDLEKRTTMEEQLQTMWKEYDNEKAEVNKKTIALKKIIEITREMLTVRENQVRDLKGKLADIEDTLDKKKTLEENSLKIQYEKQLENIKLLKALYEERMQLMESERTKLHEEIADKTKSLENQKEESSDLTMKYEMLAEELDDEKQSNEKLKTELYSMEIRTKSLEHELTVINTMFTRMLLGPYNTGSEADLDRLTALLQENHELITDMISKEECSEVASALPKLLLDLITRVDAKKEEERRNSQPIELITEESDDVLLHSIEEEFPIVSFKNATVFEKSATEDNSQLEPNVEEKPVEPIDPTVQEIVSNLPKVWKVLTELLSHQTAPEDVVTDGDERECYKNVETPQGTKSVISVSNTFIRLKNLIIEKKTLQRELGRLKHLNTHLEQRLDYQEKRLSQVHTELHKTWGVVGRMRSQHQQLHNHEKILRYELQEKRIMLSELKQELEYCKDKWERARQKNDASETEWKKLRKEFAARKTKSFTDSINDSAESGFSDEQDGESDVDRSGSHSPVGVTEEPEPSSSDEARAARLGRLEKLEQQCSLLVRKVDITTHKSNYLSNRLEELHEYYGEGVVSPPEPPPLPDFQHQTPRLTSFYDELAQRFSHPPVPPPLPEFTQSTTMRFTSFYEQLNKCHSAKIVKSLLDDILLKSVKPKVSVTMTSAQSFDERMAARTARLERLEQQCSSLVGKVTNTVERSKVLSERLGELHEECINNENKDEQNENEGEKE